VIYCEHFLPATTKRHVVIKFNCQGFFVSVHRICCRASSGPDGDGLASVAMRYMGGGDTNSLHSSYRRFVCSSRLAASHGDMW